MSTLKADKIEGVTDVNVVEIPVGIAGKYLTDLTDGGYDVDLKPSDIITKGPWVDARAYGTLGTQAAIVAALADIGSDERTLYLAPGTWSITTNLSTLANVNIKAERGAVLTIATGVTLTINGTLDAGPYQIFSCTGTGKVVFGVSSVKEVYPEWWGADSSGSADSTTPFTAACLSSTTVSLVDNSNYKISNLSLTSITNLSIKGASNSKITLVGGNLYNSFDIGNSCTGIKFYKIHFVGDGLFDVGQTKGYAIYVAGTGITDLEIKDCEFSGFGNGGVKIYSGLSRGLIDNNYFHDNVDNGAGTADITAYVGGVSELIITKNRCMSSNDVGIFLAPGSVAFDTLIVSKNILKSHTRHGISFYGNVAAGTVSNRIDISHNETASNGWSGVYYNSDVDYNGSARIGFNTSYADATTGAMGAFTTAISGSNIRPLQVVGNISELSGLYGFLYGTQGLVWSSNNIASYAVSSGFYSGTLLSNFHSVNDTAYYCASGMDFSVVGSNVSITSPKVYVIGGHGISLDASASGSKIYISDVQLYQTGAAGTSIGFRFLSKANNLLNVNGGVIDGFYTNMHFYNAVACEGIVSNVLLSNSIDRSLECAANNMQFNDIKFYNNAIGPYYGGTNNFYKYYTDTGALVLNGIYYIVGAADPSGGAGVAAPIGSSYTHSTTGQLYSKTGAADTDWVANH